MNLNIRDYVSDNHIESTNEIATDKQALLLDNSQKDKEIERLSNIIKEVREKIESVQMLGLRSSKTFISTLLNDTLEIIDKENNNEDN